MKKLFMFMIKRITFNIDSMDHSKHKKSDLELSTSIGDSSGYSSAVSSDLVSSMSFINSEAGVSTILSHAWFNVGVSPEVLEFRDVL